MMNKNVSSQQIFTGLWLCFITINDGKIDCVNKADPKEWVHPF